MAISDEKVAFDEAALADVQRHLVEHELDGWLLYDFRGSNPITAGVLGLPALSRRIYVYLPARGRPVALTHRIEQQPWRSWIGENRVYLSWQSLEEGIRYLLSDARKVAAEYSAGDAVPYLDRLPAGVVETVRKSGVELVSSGDLVSAFYSRWSPEGEASHRRAAKVLREAARAAFDLIGERLRAGEEIDEWQVRSWVVDELRREGLQVGADAVVAVNANAANPHYAPSREEHSSIRRGDVVLLDLWGKENADAIYADQTWMAFVGDAPPARVLDLWTAVRDARNAAVEFISQRTAGDQPVRGFEVDDVSRSVIQERGFGEAFIHRTGHSIDRELHGSGPNIDNLETRDERRLIRGVGFSIEPGIYLPGEIGLRTEIDVYMGPNGPEVTTPDPQQDLYLIPTR